MGEGLGLGMGMGDEDGPPGWLPGFSLPEEHRSNIHGHGVDEFVRKSEVSWPKAQSRSSFQILLCGLPPRRFCSSTLGRMVLDKII